MTLMPLVCHSRGSPCPHRGMSESWDRAEPHRLGLALREWSLLSVEVILNDCTVILITPRPVVPRKQAVASMAPPTPTAGGSGR